MRKFMRKTDVLHGFIATDLGETESDEDLHITISGHQENGGPMYQNITVIYFDTKEKADRFRYSPEGVGFDDPYGDGQDSFDHPLTSFNKFRLAVSKGPPIFVYASYN